MRRRTFLSTSILGLTLLLLTSCGPSSPQGGAGSTSSDIPELTDETIRERINDTWVREVPPENVNSQPISWGFDENEPKEITVVERQLEGTRATIVLDIKTSSAPRARNQRYLAGQIRTEWELRTGWVLRQWEIVNTENISMKYRDLPPKSPEPKNENR